MKPPTKALQTSLPRPLRLAVICAFVLLVVLNAAAQEKLSLVGRAAPEQQVQFNVFMPLRNAAKLDTLLTELHTAGSPQYHKWLTPQQFAESFGAKQEDIAAVVKELNSYGFAVTGTHSQSISVKGTVAAAERTFNVSISNAVSKHGGHRLTASGPLSLPAELSRRGAQVVHFSPTIRMHSHGQIVPQAIPDNRYSPDGPYWFDDLKQAYSFPSYQAYTGKGVTIGIVDAAGYYPPDMAAYFGHEKLAVPSISEVDIFGGTPYDPTNPFNSAETELDIQQAGGMAPDAKIVLVNLPDLSDASILAGLTTIVESNAIDVVSMSFGGPEIGYLPEFNGGVDETGILGVYDDLFKQGNAQGITFVASSGDAGANSVPAPACFDPSATSSCGSFLLSVDTPASSPHVTGVGGTNLITNYNPPSRDSSYVSEAAFGDPLTEDIFYGTPATGGYWGSGGGISIYYRKPAYQYLVNSPSRYRTVPDLSLQMGGCPTGAVDPCGPDRSAVLVAINGGYYGFIGTSISAPDFAGLTALNIQRQRSRLGNENFQIYALAAAQSIGFPLKVFHTDIPGFNGAYSTHHGYNLVLGNGTLNGKNFILAPNVPAAGIPQTPSNP